MEVVCFASPMILTLHSQLADARDAVDAKSMGNNEISFLRNDDDDGTLGTDVTVFLLLPLVEC